MPDLWPTDIADPLWLREASGRPDGDAAIGTDESDDDEQSGERVLRCRRCSAPITTEKQRVSRHGQHRHTVFNPAGIVYEIGCFQQAQGCLVPGAASLEFSWFAGYSWRVAFCSVCFEHLGWYFSGGDDGFFGLVLNRLTAD
ncbi:MAG: hypothetical protein IH612_07950 [Desulfofustis sp.]|nr:hypothetical protein [Desulfofustis sp.]